MSDVDTMRWGDTQNLRLDHVAVTGEGSVAVLHSSQMLNAHWQRPCVWRLMLSIVANIAGNTTTVVTVLLRVGVGQANQLVPLATFLANNAAVPALLFFDIPAQDMQVQFTLGPLGGNPPTAGDNVTVSAFAAPRAEPGGIVQIRDVMKTAVREPDQDGLPRWMGPGFNDGETRYR